MEAQLTWEAWALQKRDVRATHEAAEAAWRLLGAAAWRDTRVLLEDILPVEVDSIERVRHRWDCNNREAAVLDCRDYQTSIRRGVLPFAAMVRIDRRHWDDRRDASTVEAAAQVDHLSLLEEPHHLDKSFQPSE